MERNLKAGQNPPRVVAPTEEAEEEEEEEEEEEVVVVVIVVVVLGCARSYYADREVIIIFREELQNFKVEIQVFWNTGCIVTTAEDLLTFRKVAVPSPPESSSLFLGGGTF